MRKVIVIGGGAAGMMAALTAARNGHHVILLEKNEKLGKKLFITGKGRCNFTSAADEEELRNSVVTNKKFLFSAFCGFSNYDTMSFFDELGLKFKVERGNRVFPESDHSSDVIAALTREIRRLKVDVRLQAEVTEVLQENGEFFAVQVGDAQKVCTIRGDCCIIATGGRSYPNTGSTGDGYKFAMHLGHHVTDTLPALVPFVTKEEWIGQLQGLSLKNVGVVIENNGKVMYEDFGKMMFTHFGVSGPVMLSASSYVAKAIKKGTLNLILDLKPALSLKKLDERILRDFSEEKNKAFKNALDGLLPKKMIPVIVNLCGIHPDKRVHDISKAERLALANLLKHVTMTLTGLRGYSEAIITQGGVDVKEISPKTMESKLIKNVYFAGEVMDVDAVTGGFNLQIAWSTAYAAASHIR